MRRLRARRKDRRVGDGGSPRPTRKTRRRRLYRLQGGICHPGWGCGQPFPLEHLQESHLKGLGMGASRENPTDPRNAQENRVLLCHVCHRNQEAVVARMHYGWMAGKCDWITPTCDNAADVWREVEKLL